MTQKTNLDLVLMDDPPVFAGKAEARQEVADLRDKYAEALSYIESLTAQRGVYLELFHGRQDPKADMDDWGEPGPMFGPYDGIHTTYAEDIKLVIAGDGYGRLFIADGLVYYNGLYYGDWSVMDAAQITADLQPRVQAFEQSLAEAPGSAASVAESEVVSHGG